MADQDTSLRDDLMAAAESIETDEVEDEVEEKATPEATQETKTEVSTEEDQPELVVAETFDEPPEKQETVPQSKPPLDWSTENKEKWEGIDPEIQTVINDRERHVNEVLQDTAQARHSVDAFNQMFQPYIPLMQAEGVSDPMVAISGLLQTTAALSMGSQAQKAERIAGLIKHYGIDIETLDQVLSGGQAVDPGQQRLEQMLDQRMAPVNQLIERANQAEMAQRQQVDTEVGNDIQKFAADGKNVHFEAVRGVMADFMDMAARNGQAMSLEDAYQRACLTDPTIASQVTQQYAQTASENKQGMLAGKQNAASSITGHASAGASTGLTEDMTLRETIKAQLGGSGRI